MRNCLAPVKVTTICPFAKRTFRIRNSFIARFFSKRFIPCCKQLVHVRLDYATNLRQFMLAKSVIERKLKWIEPKLGGVCLFGDMNVRRLILVRHVEEEAVAFFAQHCRHLDRMTNRLTARQARPSLSEGHL